MVLKLNPFESYDYAMEIDNVAREVTVHRFVGRCGPPSLLYRLWEKWFGEGKEPAQWVEAPSVEAVREATVDINAKISRSFGGLVAGYRFRVCPCAQWVRQE